MQDLRKHYLQNSPNHHKFDKKRGTHRWVSEQGICLELQHLNKHLVRGVFCYKTMILNSVPFTGLVDRTPEKTVFVSMLDIVLLGKLHKLVLQGDIVDSTDSNREINILLHCWNSSLTDSLSSKKFELKPTKKPFIELLLNRMKDFDLGNSDSHILTS